MGKETGVNVGKTGDMLSRLPLARIGFASIALVGLFLGALLLVQTPAQTEFDSPEG